MFNVKQLAQEELMQIYGISDIIKTETTMKTTAKDVATMPVGAKPVSASVAKPVGAKSAISKQKEVLTWVSLDARLKNCSDCVLSATRKNIVYGEGNKNADLMFIGEAPDENEDNTGRPFVGAMGELLDKMIVAMQYTRESVYIANIVKCRPPINRDPFVEEVSACRDFLLAQIELIKPKVIVCLGFVAAKRLLQTDTRTYSYRGDFQDYNNIKVMPTNHPAYLLDNPNKKRDTWTDLQKVMKLLGK